MGIFNLCKAAVQGLFLKRASNHQLANALIFGAATALNACAFKPYPGVEKKIYLCSLKLVDDCKLGLTVIQSETLLGGAATAVMLTISDKQFCKDLKAFLELAKQPEMKPDLELRDRLVNKFLDYGVLL